MVIRVDLWQVTQSFKQSRVEAIGGRLSLELRAADLRYGGQAQLVA
jgi:hypothetical protein